VLKPNMVIAGKKSAREPGAVAEATLRCLKRHAKRGAGHRIPVG
jgi:fructose-bisphosphate aldolase class 1